MMKARSKLTGKCQGKQGENGLQGELGEQGQQGELGEQEKQGHLRGSIFGSLFTFKYSIWKLFIFLQIEGFERVLMLAFSKCLITCSSTTEGASCGILMAEYFLWSSKHNRTYSQVGNFLPIISRCSGAGDTVSSKNR